MFLNATESAAKADFEIHPKGVANGVCVEVVTHNKKTGEPNQAFQFLKQSIDVHLAVNLLPRTRMASLNHLLSCVGILPEVYLILIKVGCLVSGPAILFPFGSIIPIADKLLSGLILKTSR